MSNSKFGRFSYEGDSFIMCLSSNIKYNDYNDICAKIYLKFQNLKFRQYVLKYSLTDLPNCRLDSDEDIAIMMDIFEVLNYRFINIQIFDVGSSSSSSIMPSPVVMFATVKSATVSIEAHFDDGDVSSDDSNCEDDSNMILGNFVSDKMKWKYMSCEWNDYIFRAEAVKRTNPGSRCVLDTQDDRFRLLFTAYGASLHGFQYCPPILFVDGTFIKNKYKGMLLDIFPYAFAIVDAESKENWRWFFEQLAIILISDHRNIVFMTDRGSSLLDDIMEVFLSSQHSYCIKHLKDNLFSRLLKKLSVSYRDTLVSSFAAYAYARTHEKFDEAMQKLRSDGIGVVEDFMKELKPENYAFTHFPGKRYGAMSNSQAESYNNMIKDERCMPLPQLLKGVRVHMIDLFTRRRLDSSNWGNVLCPKMEKKLLKKLQIGRN
ncbi:hypothetical protein ACLB2K_032310 [Fragaria x ananassa]